MAVFLYSILLYVMILNKVFYIEYFSVTLHTAD